MNYGSKDIGPQMTELQSATEQDIGYWTQYNQDIRKAASIDIGPFMTELQSDTEQDIRQKKPDT